MGTINPTLPTAGSPRGSEELDVRAALQTIVNAINGGLDAANLAAGAISNVSLLSSAMQQLLVPTGVILPSGRAVAPAGYLPCDGAAVSRTTYSALFTAIGTGYGIGDGSTTFNVPDLQGRAPVGKGGHADVDTLGDGEGISTALQGNRTPKHAHSFIDSIAGIAGADYALLDVETDTALMTVKGSIAKLGSTTANRTNALTDAGSQAVDYYEHTTTVQTPPFVVVNFIVKT